MRANPWLKYIRQVPAKAATAGTVTSLPVPTATLSNAPVVPFTAATVPVPTLTPDEQEAVEERAAIMEYDGGLPQAAAERKAAENRQAMPHLAGVVDAFRRVFGPDQVRVVYAEENGHTRGQPPDPGVICQPPHVPVKRRRSPKEEVRA